MADTQSWFLPPPADDMRAGSSMAVWSTGTSPGALDTFRWQVTGAPGRRDNEDAGYVRLSWANVGSGVLQPTAGKDLTVVPPTGAWWQFGWDVLATDVLDCYAGSTSGSYDACGQELLVSAPDTFVHDSPGRVFWWEADGDAGNALVQFGGEVFPPAGTSTQAMFGWSMAAAYEPLDPELPWEASGFVPEWVADDINGTPRTIKVWTEDGTPGSTHVLFREKFKMALYEDCGGSSERECTWKDDDGNPKPARFHLKMGTELDLPQAWQCSWNSRTWNGVSATALMQAMGVDDPDAGATMDVTLTKVGPSDLELDITNIKVTYAGYPVPWGAAMTLAGVDSKDCLPVELPIQMSNTSWGVCE